MRVKIVTLLSSCVLGIGSVHAASINWTDGASFNGDDNQNNISLEGVLVKAANLGGNEGNLDVLVDNGTSTETITFVDDNALFPQSAFNVPTPDTSDANWNKVITRADYKNSSPFPFSLTDLLVGQEYQVEFFVWDTRSSSSNRTFSIDDGVGIPSATHTQGDGVSVIGTFTASATTQTFQITQSANAPTMNAYVLRAVGGIDPQLLFTPSDTLDIELFYPATLATGAVDVAFSYGDGINNVEITSVSVINQQHAGAYSVVGFSSPLELTDPDSNETLSVQFDVTSAYLANGDSSTGLVEVVWNEISGDTYTNTLPVSATYTVLPAELILTNSLDMTLEISDTSVSNSIAVSCTPDAVDPTNVEISAVLFANESHSGFSCATVPPTLILSESVPSSTLNIAFDNSVGGLGGGDIATATAQVIWNEAGHVENHTNTVAVSVFREKVIATITVVKDTDPTESDILNSNVVVAVNWGTTYDADGDGTVVGVATGLVANGVLFTTNPMIGDQNIPDESQTDVDVTHGEAGRGLLQVTATHVDGYSAFPASPTASLDASIKNIFASVGVSVNSDYEFAFTDLQEGATYSLQLFFSAAGQARNQEIYQKGNLSPLTSWVNASDKETIITLTWEAVSSTETFSFLPLVKDEVLSGYLFASKVTIPSPEMGVATGSGGNINISASQLISSDTYTLQCTESLVSTNWVDIATTSGVSEVNWDYTPTNNVEFLRIVSP
ncbi:hypothetical protein [Pontiella sulfatireligans]|uniref:Uncharacterized protein n=1 Tax=Pontiella sulfatireligans TaxID=2750658 RepID=A0A6C2UG45_9BACT|nr:hypothetical protein [Pontiella sulfatireligans]VGO18843.1 hypothetical protein SCARR_00896 [Pontiella sulfatireligans]